MRIVRFTHKRKQAWGVLEQGLVRELDQEPFSKVSYSGVKLKLNRLRLLAPVAPSKIVLVGLNYRDHARELKMKVSLSPVIFLKPPSSIIGPGQKIIYPKGVSRLDYEAELAVVIKRKAYKISPKIASKYIFGYTCLNDITARCLQRKDGQWTRAKSFDGFCPVGPWIETRLNPGNLRIRSYLNGRLKQNSRTSGLIFSLPRLISFISSVMTLLPGDVISTGTPSGVGPMRPQDLVEVEIEGIGILKNWIVSRGRK